MFFRQNPVPIHPDTFVWGYVWAIPAGSQTTFHASPTADFDIQK
jgi:hypothetical protein